MGRNQDAQQAKRKVSAASALSVNLSLGEGGTGMMEDPTGGGGGAERPTNAVREFFVAHMKTIVTLFMIFGTIAVIVVIVMVHKVKLAEQHSENERACLDAAIIGAGVSGTYAAWRLRHSGLKVSLFEISDRIGGRVHTRHLAGMPGDVNAELGALYYFPQHHRLLNSTIHALELTPRPLLQRHLQNHDHTTYYLRGVHLRGQSELVSDRLPYNLPPDERNLSPDQLIRMYLNKAVSNDSDLESNPLRATTKDGRHLYKDGLWNVLGRVGSKEGYSFLYDTAEWRSFLSNENAAVLGSVSMQSADKPMTIAQGMDEIPKKMVRQFLNASLNHNLRTNWKLECINKRDFKPGYKLIFTKTISNGDYTKDLYTKEEVCARRVILAMTPKSIKEVNWLPLQEKWQLQEDLETVEPVPALRVLFVFDRKLHKSHRRSSHRLTTDLPIRQVMYMGGLSHGRYLLRRHLQQLSQHTHRKRRGERKKLIQALSRQVSEKHLYMVANLDSSDTKYFTDMLAKVKHERACNRSADIVRHITSQLAQAYDIPESEVPTPESVIVKDWSKSPAGCGWHIWKKGVKVDEVMRRMIKPVERENIYVTGSTFCGGECQLWMEGALKTVDMLLQWYFNIR